MRSTESSGQSDASNAQRNGRLVFDRIDRSIGRLAKNLTPENVHRFRTNSRRVEALVEQLAPEARNKRKLLKLVSKLRRKAGKLRDLDVQVELLTNLKVPDRQNHRTQLLEFLTEERARRSRKLAKAIDGETLGELRKRLRRERSAITLEGIDPLRLALNCLPKLNPSPLTEARLHECRIAAKHARYLGELAEGSPEAKFFVDELKRAQDAIGEWHDVMRLREKAEKRFGNASDSALVSVLQNISRSRFRSASNALLTALTNLAQKQKSEVPSPGEAKSVASHAAAQSAVA